MKEQELRQFRPSDASAVQRLGNHHFDGTARARQPSENILYAELRADMAARGITPSYASWMEGLDKARRNHKRLIPNQEVRSRADAAIERLRRRLHEEFYPGDMKGGE